MTVGETLTASSLGTATAVGQTSVPEPVQIDSRQKPLQTGSEVNQPMVVAGPGGNLPGQGPSVNVVTAKIGQELVTSLHLIKDIRRLEKYQRDFFLKVKESLSHVQVLLDHQLMDMAWSDNLIDCEENLLRVSNHLQQSPNNAATAGQMAELYGILLHDREKLNHRFSELSIKSSLSEFVVNSRALLDINAVRIAAEAILKNEKPMHAQGDHSIPVDHTFFLANFCTASLASSSSVGVLPKQHPAGGAPTGSSSGSGITGYPVSNAVRYENKKINGTGQGPVVAQPGQTPALANAQVAAAAQAAAQVAQAGHQQAGQQATMTMKQNSHSVRPQQIQVQPAQTGMNGIGISDQVQAALTPTGTVGGNGSGGVPPGTGNAAGATLAPSGGGGANPVPNNSFSGIYNDSADQGVGLDNYHLGTVVPPPAVPRGQPEMSNGMYGQHELVAAISQITVDQSGAHVGGGGTAQHQQQNKAFNKAKKSWSAEAASGADPRSGQTGGGMARSENDVVASKGPRGYTSSGGGRPPSAVRSGGGSGGPRGYPPPNQGNEMNIPNDGASDSLSSTSEAGNASGPEMNTGDIGDNGKPLSFARIASLNLEKQAIGQKSPKNAGVEGTMVPSSGSGLGMGGAQQAMMMNPGAQNLAVAAAAAASMANMSMAEAAVVVQAAQQNMNHHHAMSAAMGHAAHQYSNPQQQAMAAAAAAMAAHLPIVQLPPSNNPRFFFDMAMDGKRLGRAIIEVQASLAPKMAQNFHLLVTSEKGFGYRGCQFFQAWRNESVICGDWEHNSGRGGRAALDEGPLFTPDETKLPCIRGAVGMRRMSKKHSSLNQVASQFRVILANMNTQFTGIFGHIVSGIEALDKVADIGGEGGRPEKIALVTNCGVYKG